MEIAMNKISYIVISKVSSTIYQFYYWTLRFGRNTAKQIFILATDQQPDTNRTSMEHLSFPATPIGSKELAVGSMRLGNNIMTEANQSSASIDRWVHGDWYLYLGSQKSGNKMSVDFGRNTDDKIGMEPSRTIRRPHPQITRTRPRNCNISDLVSRVSPWHVKMKSGSENLV